MADSTPTPTPTPTPIDDTSDPLRHWCYHCDRRVAIESTSDLSADVICFVCKSGFVESLPPSPSPSPSPDHFLQVLRLIAQAARDDHAPPHAPPHEPHAPLPDPAFDFDSWYQHHDDEEDDDDDQEGGDVEEVEEDEEDEEEEDGDEEVEVRRWRDVIRRRLVEDRLRRRQREVIREEEGELGTRRNRILDWAEILLGLEDNSVELRLQMPRLDTYVGNPGDYVDAAGYEELLQNLAESDNGGRRGAPPAGTAAVAGLETVMINSEEEVIVCAVCKDLVSVGESAKRLPCGHRYHGDCIVPWLSARNSCPICRFELPTDDPEYEEERKKMGKAERCDAVGGSTSTARPGSAGGDVE